MFRKSIALVALTLCAVSAFAAPRPSEVKAAFAAHDYLKAESLLGQVLAEKPGSAPAHWQLGQVYAAEGKHKQALNEMRQAQQLDPSFKFASNAANAVKIIGDEQTLVAPPVAVVASPITIPQGYAVVAQAAPAPVQVDSGHGAGFFIFLVLLIGGIGVGAYFLIFGKKREENDARVAREKEMAAQKAQLLDNSKDLDDAILIAKTSAIPEDERVLILQQIAELQKTTRSYLADLKDGKTISNSSLNKLNEVVATITERAQHGIPVENPKPTPTPPYSPVSAAPAPDWVAPPVHPAPAPSYVAPTPTQTVFHHHYPAPAPAPVVVNNGNGDFLTGMLVGEALNRPERVVERTVYVEERAPAPAPRYERQLDTSQDDTYEAPAPEPERYSPAPAIDTSSNDSWDSGSTNMDSGSSDSSSGDSY